MSLIKTRQHIISYCSILALGLISTSVLAGSSSADLPNGASCEVSITYPENEDPFLLPTGETTKDIDVIGSASVGEGDPLKASFIYVIDASGSTASGGGTGCAPILECERQFVKQLNWQIIMEDVSDEVGIVAYGSDSEIADVLPDTGEQMIIAPDDPNTAMIPLYVNTVVDSIFSQSTSNGGIGEFTEKTFGQFTNCRAALEDALTVANVTTNERKIVVFTSDGICNRGGSEGFNAAVQALADANIIVHSIAVGTGTSCETDQGNGSLLAMAQGTGGQCFQVPDPGDLPDIIPNFIGSSLDSLEIQVDGGTSISIPNDDIEPDALPQNPGPKSVNYTALALDLEAGTHEICVTAYCSDPLGSNHATQCETVEIIAQQPPVAVDDTYSTSEDTSLIISAPGVLNNDTDPNGDTLTVTSNTNPSHGTVTQNSDGSLTYTPNANFCGVDSYTYTISDGHGGTDTATVTINVACINDQPDAQDDTYNTSEDTPLTVNPDDGVLANDTDPDGDTLTVTSNTAPGHGTVTQNSDGSLTYTPNANFCGVDSYTYTISDGHGGTDTATVLINVSCVNDPPNAQDDFYSATEDTPLTINAPGVLLNDSDVEGDTLTVISATQPNQGSVTQDSNGSLTYIPDAHFCGVDSYIYTISDGNGGMDTATVTIEIACQGRMTGGGSVFGSGQNRVTHGFELHCSADDQPNNLEVNWNKGDRFHLEQLTAASCINDPDINEGMPTAGFDTYIGSGTGRYNGVSGATIEWYFTDAGEPGKDNDIATILIRDVNNNVVLSVNGSLNQGNHQAHDDD